MQLTCTQVYACNGVAVQLRGQFSGAGGSAHLPYTLIIHRRLTLSSHMPVERMQQAPFRDMRLRSRARLRRLAVAAKRRLGCAPPLNVLLAAIRRPASTHSLGCPAFKLASQGYCWRTAWHGHSLWHALALPLVRHSCPSQDHDGYQNPMWSAAAWRRPFEALGAL